MTEATLRVLTAWREAGPVPMYHERAKLRLRREWPSLYVALVMLEQEEARRAN